LAIGFMAEDLYFLNASPHDLMNGAGRILSRNSRHGFCFKISNMVRQVVLEPTFPPMRLKGDERFLGDSDFVESVIKAAEERLRKDLN